PMLVSATLPQLVPFFYYDTAPPELYTLSLHDALPIFCGGAKATCQAAGVKVSQPGADSWHSHTPGRLTPTPDGYQVYTHKLGYGDRKSTRLNSSHVKISYAVFCLKKKKKK